ncbi:MAG: ABC transporter permease [Deltaproteobacteria bacterium CG07_land_8_20_14_0_80_38_7]|nr:MAG: ABC transporter permease [Deltaproteobacteria bacterium CG07_land_8_20_14_0_80_38_7]
MALAALLSGCVAGPDFKPSHDSAPQTYLRGNQPAETVSSEGSGGTAQRLVRGNDIPSRWWSLFRSEPLDRLVRQALERSPTLAQAQARLVQAQETLNAQTGATKYPSADVGLSAKRQQVDLASMGMSGVKDPQPFALYNVSASVAYTFDFFGKNRRTLEALSAKVDYQSFEWEAAQQTLAANVVSAVIRQASLNSRIGCISNLLAVQERQLTIMETQHKAGGVSSLDLENQKLLLAQTRASLPTLENQAARIGHQLAVYLGRPPAEADIAAFDLNGLYLPDELPLSLPSALARQRPDIRAAEALWHQACARVGVATADLYPQVSLSGSLGAQDTHAADMLNSLNVWSIGANLMQPVFRGGELKAKKRGAVAAYDEAAAVYKQAVLQGFQEVADALHALESDARTLRERTDAVRHARAGYDIAQSQFKNGAISHLELLDAQRQLMQTELDRIQARADRYADSAALLHALGGEWRE